MITIGHLDLNIVEHCNMTCVNCSHASPVAAPWSMTLETIERDLLALKPILRCRNLNLVGGEPLLHKQLVEIMRLVKSIRIDETTCVITNGTLLPRMGAEFWSELEYLSISVYPTLPPANVNLAESKSREFAFGLGTRVFTDFHRQFRNEPNDGSHFASCHWKSDCFTVHEGHFYLCPQSAFFPKRFTGAPENIDGYPLAEVSEEGLQLFIERTVPLTACRICMANEMKSAPWQEATRKEWLETSKSI